MWTEYIEALSWPIQLFLDDVIKKDIWEQIYEVVMATETLGLKRVYLKHERLQEAEK